MLVFFYQFAESLKNSPGRRDKFILITTTLSLIINLALWLFLFFELKKIMAENPMATTIPLHYNVFFGIDLFGHWQKAFFLPLIALVILIVNTILGLWLYSKKSLLSYFLVGIALLVQITLAVSGLLMILINL